MVVFYVLIAVAAFSNSIMDTISHRWSTSRFSGLVGFWGNWFSNQSWKNKYVDWDSGNKERKKITFFGIKTPVNFPVQLTDAWHFFKSLMIFCLIGIVFVPIQGNPLVWWVSGGLVWNVVFLIFYKVVWKK